MSLLVLNKKNDFRGIGGKAKNLLRLESLKINIPKWMVISEEVVTAQLPADISVENADAVFQQLEIPENILCEIKDFVKQFEGNTTFAVRSSCLDEDGKQFSFAGQFKSFLHVSVEDLEEKIKAVWQSAVSERVIHYRLENNLPVQFGMAVIIQEMVESEISGVAFGIDPVSGDADKKIISALWGLGEGIVSGALDADNFILSNQGVEVQLASKTQGYFKNNKNNGIEKRSIEKENQNIRCLSDEQVRFIAQLLEQLETEMGAPQDIEFAFRKNEFFLLQTRPVTTTTKGDAEYTLWDNSNIIESYPGVTTPLTFSFILKMYESVYRQFVQILGVRSSEIEKHHSIFANTLGLIRGRVYYNLLNWYKMLAMLPGYSLNAQFMEEMMGVKERFVLKEKMEMGKGWAWLRSFWMILNMIKLHWNLKKDRKKFTGKVEQILSNYNKINFNELTAQEIIEKYHRLEEELLLEWKAPLVNDFFAMIWFGLLRKLTNKYCPELPNIQNDLLCGSQDIISTQPIHQTIEIANAINSDPKAKQFFKEKTPGVIGKGLEQGMFPKIKLKIDEYIKKFGERCVGELKLETISYAQNPVLFIGIIQSYVTQEIFKNKSSENIEETLREKAEARMAEILKGKPLRRFWFNFVKSQARDLVSNRENLRYERTRAFGTVRKMMTALGDVWAKAGKLENARDVFYMELSEILTGDKVFKSSMKNKINKRKKEFKIYKKQPIPSERFFTYGNNFEDKYIYSKDKIQKTEGDLKGIGCCPGVVTGQVRIVMNPNEVKSVEGDILLTTSTDPGWVTLFPTASAIIVERGSLLSHSAIVSREMGIPCIVSVTGLLRTLKTGDWIEMNGSTGEIKIIDI